MIRGDHSRNVSAVRAEVENRIEHSILEYVVALAQGSVPHFSLRITDSKSKVKKQESQKGKKLPDGLVQVHESFLVETPHSPNINRHTQNRLTLHRSRRHCHLMIVMSQLHANFSTFSRLSCQDSSLVWTNTTQRDLFYRLLSFFSSQAELNQIIVDISGMLLVSRASLGIVAAARGFIFGPLVIQIQDTMIDCSTLPVLIREDIALDPQVAFRYPSVNSPQCILLIEKEGIFRSLVDNHFTSLIPCILLTCMGYPSIACRALAKRLHSVLKLPILGVFDYNPSGLSIYFTFKLGSTRMLEASEYVLPELHWLGLSYGDLQALHLDPILFTGFTKRDVALTKSFLQLECVQINAPLKEEIEQMLRYQRKTELQALNSLGFGYVWNAYLPYKLQQGMYI